MLTKEILKLESRDIGIEWKVESHFLREISIELLAKFHAKMLQLARYCKSFERLLFYIVKFNNPRSLLNE